MSQSKRVKCVVVFEAGDGLQDECRVAFAPELLESGDDVRQLERVQEATGRSDIVRLESVTPIEPSALRGKPVMSAEPFAELDQLLVECFRREKLFLVDPTIIADEDFPENRRVEFQRGWKVSEELFELRFESSQRFAEIALKCREVGAETRRNDLRVDDLLRDAAAVECSIRSWDRDVTTDTEGIDRHDWSETVLANLELERQSVSHHLVMLSAEVVAYRAAIAENENL